MKTPRFLFVLACSAAVFAAGCGGDDENNDTSASTQEKPAQTTTQADQPATGGGETTAEGMMACLKKAGYEVEDSDTNFTLTSLNEGNKTDDIHALELELPASAKSGASMEIFVFKDKDLADEKLEVVESLGSNVEQKGNAILNYGQADNKETYSKAPACIAG
jgi:hypothetical protein